MLRGIGAALALAVLATPLSAEESSTFDQEYLWEHDLSARQLTALAEAMPTDMYAWRPGEGVRSVSEVYVHVALGNFLLLDVAGRAAPEDLFGKIATSGPERFRVLIERNAELEKSVAEKERVVALLKRSLDAVRAAMESASAAELERLVRFFGRDTTARAVYLRMLVHAHEHLGQAIAYARVNGVVPPWSRPAPKE